MDSHAFHSQTDEVDIFNTTPEKPSGPSNSGHDQIKTQASSPTREVLSHVAQEHLIPAENSMQAFATSGNTKARQRRHLITVAATRSRPRILTLFVCASGLLFHLLGIDLGLRLMNGYTEPRLHRAEVQLQAANSDLFREQLIYSNLDRISGATLDRRYGENYEQCLARGLYLAEDAFLGLDLTQYPEVRNRTMEWATHNCGRLLHTPQLLRPEVLRFWTPTSKYRQFAEQAFTRIRTRAALLRRLWFGVESRLAPKPIVAEQSNSTAKRSKLATRMPFSLTLDCHGPPPCRLVDSRSSNSTSRSASSEDAVASALKQVQKWSWPFDRVFRINRYMVSALALLQTLFGALFLLAVLVSRPRPQPKSLLSTRLAGVWPRVCNAIARLHKDEELALGLFINSAMYALLHYQLEYVIEEFDRPLLPVGAAVCAFHVPQTLAFFDPVSIKTETVRSFCRSIKELYMISQGAEPHQLAVQECRRSVCQPSDAKPASKIAARFISPLTPISEDIQQERKAMHAEQGKRPCADFGLEAGYATETDSDYDSDVQQASYVDLTGGATPTFSEDGSDWSVVED
ncbi:DNA-(apurinic or apyrimidinic site) lyase [Ascochyta rabiei]|uniref:DNA-(apurinic or apyrimidinic site) lyase n=1 Tax=Didymella rabiei TaxID=5454 RepID=UPI00220BE4F0|nr:DNA-(apurinic or apyrimidinic site) lyase [Ascochyta rabiei]UPX17265.1 DNA-(apurinic or apyrimidinic site) lyase [Ascochyta rabiei]